MSIPDRGKPVEFRKVAAEPSPSPTAAGETPPAKHLLQGRAPAGQKPPHVEYFGEADVDGFPSDTPQWVAFCPDCGAKLALDEHEACPFFGGPEVDKDGFVVAVHCGRRKAPESP